MRVNSRGGKTVLEKPDIEAIDRVTHLTRAIGFHFGAGSVSNNPALAKAADEAHKSLAILAPLAKAQQETTPQDKAPQTPKAPQK